VYSCSQIAQVFPKSKLQSLTSYLLPSLLLSVCYTTRRFVGHTSRLCAQIQPKEQQSYTSCIIVGSRLPAAGISFATLEVCNGNTVRS
jgi:hypothetical protein